MKAHIGNSYESPVFHATSAEDDKKLYDLTSKMKELAAKVKSGYDTDNAIRVIDNAHGLADTVLEFLKASNWAR